MNNNKNQISLDDAVLWTKIWRIACPNNCKAFSIPVSDLVNVLKEIGVLVLDEETEQYSIEKTINGVRAYMAIDPENGLPGGGEKLLLVGTHPEKNTKTGKMVQRDIINGKLDNKGQIIDDKLYGADNLGDPDPNTGIYDFTSPCPNVCDDDSPLYGG